MPPIIMYRHRSLDRDAPLSPSSTSWKYPFPRDSWQTASPLCPSLSFRYTQEFKGESDNRVQNHPAVRGMHVFLAACVAIIAIGVMGQFALSALQRPTGLAYTTDVVRIDPSWIGPSTQP